MIQRKSQVNFDWHNYQENLSSDSTDPDDSLGTSSTGIVIREILVSIWMIQRKPQVNFDQHSNQENLSSDLTDPDDILGVSSTGIVRREILG